MDHESTCRVCTVVLESHIVGQGQESKESVRAGAEPECHHGNATGMDLGEAWQQPALCL